jgi:hypothetical protein
MNPHARRRTLLLSAAAGAGLGLGPAGFAWASAPLATPTLDVP